MQLPAPLQPPPPALRIFPRGIIEDPEPGFPSVEKDGANRSMQPARTWVLRAPGQWRRASHHTYATPVISRQPTRARRSCPPPHSYPPLHSHAPCLSVCRVCVYDCAFRYGWLSVMAHKSAHTRGDTRVPTQECRASSRAIPIPVATKHT